MSDNNVTWVPVIDSRGFDRDQDGNLYAYCRAVAAPTWSQEPPTEAGLRRVGDIPCGALFADANNVVYVRLRVDTEHGAPVCLDIKSGHVVTHWMPGAVVRGPLQLSPTVPQPPGVGP